MVSTQEESVIIIVLDDASPTNYVERVCFEFKGRVQYFRNDVNLGISENFNKAVQVSNTEFVQIIGQDDFLTDSMLSVIQSAGKIQNSCFGIHSNVSVINNKSKTSFSFSDITKFILTPRRNALVQCDKLKRSLLFGNWTYFPAIIWRKEVIVNYLFSSNYKYCMDLDYLLKLSQDGLNLFVSTCNGFTYRRHNESASMSAPRGRLNEELLIIKKFRSRGGITNSIINLGILPRINYFVCRHGLPMVLGLKSIFKS